MRPIPPAACDPAGAVDSVSESTALAPGYVPPPPPPGRGGLPRISLTSTDRQRLLHAVRSPTVAQRLARRSQIVLLAADGLSVAEIAGRVRVSYPTIRLWARRFAQAGIEGIRNDAPGRGRPPSIDRAWLRERFFEPGADGALRPRGSVRQIASELGASPSSVWRALRQASLHAGQ